MNVEDLPVAVIVLDSEQKISTANDAACALLGFPDGGLTGLSAVEAFRPRRPSGEDILGAGWHPSTALRGTRRINEQEVLARRADGKEIELLVEGAYERNAEGDLMGATILIRLRHSGPRRPRSGVRIVSAVSHELRSPLTSVRGYTSLLLKRWDDVSDDDRRQMLQQIDRDARRISRMINELLDISRLESGKLVINRSEVKLDKLAEEVIENVKLSWPELDAQVAFPDDFPSVRADADKITQVLSNLVENACKYGSPKGIALSGSTIGGQPAVEVSDEGPGIPPGDMNHLFKQFFRSAEGRPTGTGLGLWISRGIVEAHGGELTAYPGRTAGTTFRFTLPFPTHALPTDTK